MFLSWLSRQSVLDLCQCVCVPACVCVCVKLSDTVLTEKAATLNRLLSLLSLTAAQRLNSDIAKKPLDDCWMKTWSI